MAKISATNRKIHKKLNPITPKTRTLVPISSWWKLKGATGSPLIGKKIFKLKNIQTEGLMGVSLVDDKNYVQDVVNHLHSVTPVVTGSQHAIWAIAGKRHKLRQSNQG